MNLSPRNSSEFTTAESQANKMFDRYYEKRYGKVPDENSDKSEISKYTQLKNTFQHAYVSAYFTYKYSPEETRMLGLIKEQQTLDKEIKAHTHTKKDVETKRGEDIAFKDGNRDMWNNEMGISYAAKGKAKNQSLDEVGKNIFNEIVDGHDFILDYQNDKRRWMGVTDINSYKKMLNNEILSNYRNNPNNINLAGKVLGDVLVNSVKNAFSKETREKIQNKLKEETEKKLDKIKKDKSVTSSEFAAHNNLSDNRITDPFLQGFYGEPKDTRTSSQRVADRIDNDELDDNDIAFLDGFNYDQPDRYLISEANKRRKERARQTGNKGKGPHGEDGYWYTTKQGKHVFVPDDKTA